MRVLAAIALGLQAAFGCPGAEEGRRQLARFLEAVKNPPAESHPPVRRKNLYPFPR